MKIVKACVLAGWNDSQMRVLAINCIQIHRDNRPQHKEGLYIF